MRWLKRILITLVLLAALGQGALIALSDPRPTGRTGPEADELARRVQAAVDTEAWERTRALRWGFRDRNQHLWDRDRGLSEVRWGDIRVIRATDGRVGQAFEGGRRVTGARAAELFAEAHKRFINDAFWLNPMATFFDEDVSRELVEVLGQPTEALAVQYGSGGVTPGDLYLWTVGDGGLPTEWRMWVSILPVGGVRIGWSDWQTLDTGARVARHHETPVGGFNLVNIEGAETLADLVGNEDPFAPLFKAP